VQDRVRSNRCAWSDRIIIDAALGSALMYFLDPEKGQGRRQRVLSVNLRAKQAANEAAEE
jgi:phage gp46-like protein